jgi:cytochrome P450
MRDPRNFSPHPYSFLPERWLGKEIRSKIEPGIFKDPDEYVHNTIAFVPFSLGPSVCAGKNLAYLEMRMLVCSIMHKFDLRFEDGYRAKRYEEEMGDFFVMMRGRLPVVLTRRK